MRSTGTYISAVGHVGLIGWLILGWGFSSEPLPFEVSEVSVVSGEEYAAIVAATTPNPATADPATPAAPVEDTAPDAASTPDTPTESAQPDAVTPPADDAPPPDAPAPPPQADVTDTAPVEPDQTATATPAAPDLPPSDRPQERPSDRVAPQPVAPPPPDTAVAEIPQDSAEPDQVAPAEVVEEPAEAAAPEEATSQIVTEADTPSGAVETSPRPQTRPVRQAQTAPATPEQTTTASSSPEPDAVDDAVAAALAANTASSAPDLPAGPPMTGSEKEGFRVAVNACWNVDPGSVAARVTVEVGFTLAQDGRVQGEVRLLSSDGDQSATNTAFQAARRAILRCGANGYDLPADKYDQWRDVVITFDPSGMRLR